MTRCILFLLRDDDVRSRKKDRNRCYDGEKCEEYQANTVDHHGGKLPVIVDMRIFFVVSDLIGDDTQFFQDTRKFTMGAEAVVQ